MAVDKKAEANGNTPEKVPDSNGVLSKDAKRRKKEQEAKDAELSEEDLELKQNLEMMLERIKENDSGVQANALKVCASSVQQACICVCHAWLLVVACMTLVLADLCSRAAA